MLLRLRFKPWAVFLLLIYPVTSSQATVDIEELAQMEVTMRRYNGTPTEGFLSVDFLDRANLESFPQRRLDDGLRAIPGFSLFRRASSKVAHPTTQGVSLRHLGPNGAGRTLVLLDGVPMNDPFGGWVYWNRFPTGRIGEIEILQGGGAGLWGNAALAGTIQLFSRRESENFTFLETSGGNRDTADVLFSARRSFFAGEAFITAGSFTTDGYSVIRADQRGLVDQNAYSEAQMVEGGVEIKIAETTLFSSRGSHFRESRGNGTPLAGNETEGYNFSARLRHQFPAEDSLIEVLFYFQERDFSSSFSAVSEDRSSERPALDQFNVPAQSFGGGLIGGGSIGEKHRIAAGFDTRWVAGETNEQFFFNGETFNFQRESGGDQTLFGMFVEDTWDAGTLLKITLSARIDYWENKAGFRKRTDLRTGEVVRDEKFAAREDWVGNGRLGVAYQLSNSVRVRGHVATGFRVPTLNEFFRPFRVRSDITEANPALVPERLYGGEIGVEWAALGTKRFSVTYFDNFLKEAVTNITLDSGPGFVAPCGFVPTGGSCRQRRNLDGVRARGFELQSLIPMGQNWTFTVRYLYSDSQITQSDDDPFLVNNRLAQTPKHSGTATLLWRTTSRLQNTFQLRYSSTQFENDLNSLKLDSFLVFDWSMALTIQEGFSLFFSIENVTETEFESGRASNGIVSIGAPRLINGGIRLRF
ncbi:MAG: Colicin I receptor [Candidatus Moanabacter tarae]|uniref:Colicin I receptor n=1 Tax=Candidatus Moanibacter tarae TaxID=2200854 RepID=A0A2Z4AS12_9BACT|nr:MAG: Colicin I receptor [Candidatus Moanabacter tarae]